MSWIVAGIAVGTWAIDKIGKGVTAAGQKGSVQAGRRAAGDIYTERLGLLGERRDISQDISTLQYDVAGQQYGLAGEQYGLAGQKAGLGAKIAQNQYTSGMEDVSRGTRSGMRGIQQSINASGRTGFARADTSAATSQKSDILNKYTSETQKLFAGNQLAAEQRGLEMGAAGLGYKAAGQEYETAADQLAISKREQSLAYTTGALQAEDMWETTKTELNQTLTGFWEGAFG